MPDISERVKSLKENIGGAVMFMKKLLCILIVVNLLLCSCTNENKRNSTLNIEKIYDRKSVEEYMNQLKLEYKDFDFSICNMNEKEEKYYIKAKHLEYEMDKAKEIVDEAYEKGIEVLAYLGSFMTCLVTYGYNNEHKSGWGIVGFAIPDDVQQNIHDNNFVKQYLADNEIVNKDCYSTIYSIAAAFANGYINGNWEENCSWNEEKGGYYFAKYIDEIKKLEPLEGYPAFLEYYEEEGRIYVVFDGCEMIIDKETWISYFENVREENDSISDVEYRAIINTYESLKNYMNGNKSVQFDLKDLEIIYKGYEHIGKLNIYEAPIDVEEYIAMDKYEDTMNEYCNFMVKYSESDGTDLSLLADYGVYMKKYSEAMEAFEKWEGEDMNTVESAYYFEVQTRINKRLFEVAQ